MKTYDYTDILSLICTVRGKFGMYASWDPSINIADVSESAPWLKELNFSLFMNGEIYMTFDSEEEMQKAFSETKGEDSKAEIKVFAITCDDMGRIMGENT